LPVAERSLSTSAVVSRPIPFFPPFRDLARCPQTARACAARMLRSWILFPPLRRERAPRGLPLPGPTRAPSKEGLRAPRRSRHARRSVYRMPLSSLAPREDRHLLWKEILAHTGN